MDTPSLNRTAPAAPLLVLAEELAARGFRLALLLERAGIPISDLAGGDASVSAATIGRVVGDAVALPGCRDLALRAGARCSLAWAGALGAAARHAPTLGDALADLERLPQVQDTVGGLSLQRVAEEAHFSYQLHDADVPNAPLLYEMALGAMCAGLRELTGGAVTPWVVRVPCRRPRDLAPYRTYLGPHLKFDAVVAELVFDAAALERPLRTASPVQRRVALAQIAHHVSRREPLICVSVRSAIHAGLSRGACSRAGVAERCGLHERAMGRRLQSSGTSFQELLDHEREIRARLLLRHTSVSVDRIGRALGYRDCTVFGRAFRRWTGLLPGEFRAQFAQPPSAIASPTRAIPPVRNASPTMAGLAIV